MHKQRAAGLNNHRHRVWSQILIRPPQRLIFPNREAEEGYVGKKHFNYNNSDNVVLQSPEPQKYVRKDKLDIGDIQGAKPKLIQPLENVRKYYKRDSGSLETGQIRRTKTEAQDSLDLLIRHGDQKKNKRNNFQDQISSYLWKRNIQLTKQNILGIYNPGPDPGQKHNMITAGLRNPTYLSNLNVP